MKNTPDTVTWTINNFPRRTKDCYSAWLKSNRTTIRDHLEYLILKTLREAGVDFPVFDFDDLLERMRQKGAGKNAIAQHSPAT